MRRQFLFGCLFIALAAVIFSTMEVLLKLPAVAGAFHPMQITLERFLVGGICLLPVAGWTLRRKGIRLTRRDVGTFALTGLFCVPLSMVLYQLAITHGQANVVAVLFSGNPIFVTLLAFLLLHETIAWNNLLALVLEVLGIGAIAGLGGSAVSLSSVALAVLAALFFAAYAVLGKRQTARTGSLVVTCGSFLWGGLELGALLLLGRTEVGSALFGQLGLTMFQDVPFLQGLTGQTLPYFLFIGIVNTALGYVFHMLAIEKTSAIHGSLVFFFKPILAPLFALSELGDAVTPPILLGIVCFLAGSLVSILPDILRARRAGQGRLAGEAAPQHEGKGR